MKYSEYTLTAIFRDEGGKTWKSTIWRYYAKAEYALNAINKLIAQHKGTTAEIIDYTITRTELT